MKKTLLSVALVCTGITSASAQVGQPYIHDPSTIAECEGKYYTFGTGGGGLISPDGWTWKGGAVRPGGGAAPDVMKIGNRYLVIYGATGGGLGGGHNGRILTMWNNTLDPNSPNFKYTEPIEVAASDGLEDQTEEPESVEAKITEDLPAGPARTQTSPGSDPAPYPRHLLPGTGGLCRE